MTTTDVPQAAEAAVEPVHELTLEEALTAALTLHRGGHLDEAEELYRRVLAIWPGQPDAMHYLGILLHHKGRGDEAVDWIRRSIAANPGQAGAFNNLGNVLLEQKRPAEAVEAYRSAVALAPEAAQIHNNLGAVLKALGRAEEAEAAYRRAIDIDPRYEDAYSNLGHLLARIGRVKEAIEWHCKAVLLAPCNSKTRYHLGIAYYTIGEVAKAAEVFGQWLKDEPDHPIARHMHAACSGEGVPPRADDAYVARVFDTFAQSFDRKLAMLDYRAPGLVAEALIAALGPAAGGAPPLADCLDAGCGTGLCGPLVAAHVGRLVGIDLSEKMLERARGRGVYDALETAELTAYLEAHPRSFDAIIAADVLVYFGDLHGFAGAAARSLRPGGHLVFTVEEKLGAQGGAGFRINPHGRYSHEEAYVRRVLADAGLAVGAIGRASLRTEDLEPVAGLVVAARRPGAAQ